MTPDPGAAAAFYREVFGWTPQEGETPSGMPYTTLLVGEQPTGGMMPPPQEGMPPIWVVYFAVADADATIEKVNAAGGLVPFGPMDVPEVGRVAWLNDPQGATVSILQPAPQLG